MDIKQLNYFVTVAKYKSFSKAGQILHITQPTISKLVKGLEDELGVVLLDRSTKQVQLTDAGEVVLRQAEQIINSFDNLATELSDVLKVHKGNIRIGTPPMVGANFFPRVLAGFNSRFPQINIQLIEDGAVKVEQAVSAGELDLGVAVQPFMQDTFDFFPFFAENLRLVVHPSHRFAKRREVELSELKNEVFIFFREDFTLHHFIRAKCQDAGFMPQVLFESSQWDFISEMVAANLGIALLPETICKELDEQRLKSINLVSPSIPWNLALIWRRDRYLSFATREFIRFTREMLQTIREVKR